MKSHAVLHPPYSTVSEFDETPSTLATLSSRCQSGKITWRTPQNGQIVTFYMSRRTFTVCLNGNFPGASIYRLTGPSRMLLTDANSTGPLGCFKSHCGHVSLLLEVDMELSPGLLKYTYSGASDSSKFDFFCGMHKHTVFMECTTLYSIHI